MDNIQIGNDVFRTTKLDLFVQFHLVRKMLPVMVAFANFRDPTKRGNPVALLGPLADVLAKMSKEDSEEVILSCLAVVQKKVGPAWASVKAAGSNALMDSDMSLVVALDLVRNVLQENLGSFFAVAEQLFPAMFSSAEPQAPDLSP